MSETYSVSGLDQIEQMVSEMFISVRFESSEQDPTFTVNQTATGPIVVGRMFYDMNVDMDVAPLGGIGVVHSRSGLACYRSRGEERRWRPGEVFVSSDPADSFTSSLDHLDCDFTIFDPTLLDDVAHSAPGETGPVRLTDYKPVSEQAARRWMACLEFVRDAAAQPDLSPLVLGSISRLLAATTLATFPNNASVEPTAEDRRDSHPATIRRAVAFIESHLDLDLTVIDIARAASVSPRALQLAFRRHLDTTPMRYLRRVRLDRAHAELQSASPTVDTVTAIAARWGFARPSRFAAEYRAAYGHYPHQTLRDLS